MKSILKLMFGLIILFTLVARSSGQSFSATYTYDANGNRILATVTYTLKSVKLDTAAKAQLTDTVSGITVRIFPNPTRGDLTIEIDGVTPGRFASGGSIKIWDMQGRDVKDISTVSNVNPVDLSGLPNGMYFLKIYFNGTVKSYKIIKE